MAVTPIKKIAGALDQASPVKFREKLIYKAPLEIPEVNKRFDFSPVIKVLEYNDLENDYWLRSKKKAFILQLKYGHTGILLIHPETKESLAYSWFAYNCKPPFGIPKLPQNCAWLCNTEVREDYRGYGLQKLLIRERLVILHQIHRTKEVYTDVMKDNLPSRKNIINMGFSECGIYYVLSLGIRRFDYLSTKWGYWNKNKEHPPV